MRLLTTALLALVLAAPLRAQEATPVRDVAIFLYPGVELLDFAGPGEVFQAAGSASGRPFRVFTVAETKEPLTSQGFVTIQPTYDFSDCPQPAIVVLPGGSVPVRRPQVIAWLERVAPECEVVMSVCNGALLLAKAGLLDGLEATTHHGSLRALALASPSIRVRPERRFVDNGKVVTTAGVSAGIDGALHVMSRLVGRASAQATADYMEYRWEPEAAEAYQRGRNEAAALEASLELVRVVVADGVDAALARRKAMDPAPGEAELNAAGYSLLLSADRPADARRVFELVTAAHPESPNAWDSLAEACEALGDTEAALRCARKCLERIDGGQLDPAFRERIRKAAQERIERLAGSEGGAKSAGWVCPPCGGGCCERVYERSGACEGCGMRLIPRQAPESRADELVRALESGRLRAEDVLADAGAAALLRDRETRRALSEFLREHPAEGRLELVTADEPGEHLSMRVRVVAPETGEPLAGALVRVHHTDARGVYSDEEDEFLPRLFGWARTDARGELAIATLLPGPYPEGATPRHLHFELRAEGRAPVFPEVGFQGDPVLTPEILDEARRNGWPIVPLSEREEGGYACEATLVAGARTGER